MIYKKETDMYPDVVTWLSRALKDKYIKAKIDVRDTHARPLNDYITRNDLANYFRTDMWRTFEINVDITAFVTYGGAFDLCFVECKLTPISLGDVSQLLGYSRVANPLFSLLISARGIGSSVSDLLKVYSRTDILEYCWEKGKAPRTIILGTWNTGAKTVESASVLPAGYSAI